MKNFIKSGLTILMMLVSLQNVSATECNCYNFDQNLPPSFLFGVGPNSNNTAYTVLNASLNWGDCAGSGGTYTVTWDYGDGTTETFVYTGNGYTLSSNVNHDFVWGGNYYVCVTIKYSYSNAGIPKSCTREFCEFITIDGPICDAQPDFFVMNYDDYSGRIKVVDQSHQGSTGSVVSQVWDIDGSTYNGSSAEHIFTQSGNYLICLEIVLIDPSTGDCCIDKHCETVNVVVNEEPCSMDPDFNYDCFTNDCIFQFNGKKGASNRNVKSWYWDFGDGGSSTEQNPFHTYVSSGTKTICLTIVGEDGDGQECCVETYCRDITFECQGIDYAINCDDGGGSLPNFLQPGSTLGAADVRSLELQPNPAHSSTKLSYELSNDAAEVSIVLLDASGNVVRNLVNNESRVQGVQSTDIETSSLAPGIYLIRIQTGASSRTAKLVVN